MKFEISNLTKQMDSEVNERKEKKNFLPFEILMDKLWRETKLLN